MPMAAYYTGAHSIESIYPNFLYIKMNDSSDHDTIDALIEELD